MLSRIVVLLPLLTGCHGVSAQTYLSFGAGNESCATWLDNPASQRLGAEYVAGLWSGLNVAGLRGSHTVGSSTDAKGKIGEVKRYCLDRPSAALADATMAVWSEFQQQAR